MDLILISGLISSLGAILVGLLFIIYWKRRTKVSYSPFLFAVLLFIISVGLKSVWTTLTDAQIHNFLSSVLGTSLGNLTDWIYLGLLTGIFEVGIVYIWVRYSRLKDYNFNQATSFGIGYGAAEAIILGTISLIAALTIPQAILMPNILSVDSPSLIAIVTDTIIPIIDRFLAVFIHAFAAVLIFASIKNKIPGLFCLAFIYKSSIDVIANALVGLSLTTSLYYTWIFEVVILIYAIAGFYGIKWIKNQYYHEISD